MTASSVTRGRLHSFSVEVDLISGQPDDSLAQSSQIGMLVGDWITMRMMLTLRLLTHRGTMQSNMNRNKEDMNGIEKDMNGRERAYLLPFKPSVDGENVDAAPCVSSRIHPVNMKESIGTSINFFVHSVDSKESSLY